MFDCQIFVGNICDIGSEQLREYCSQFGSLIDMKIHRDREQNIYHCFAFLTYKTVRCVDNFMLKRPHFIENRNIFVKRALPRSRASIPERLIVTNRLVLKNRQKFNREKLRQYFEEFGKINKFDYENGFVDFEDYDSVDRVLILRPNKIDDREIKLTKIPSNESELIDTKSERSSTDSISSRLAMIQVDLDLRTKCEKLEKQFQDYKINKEIELADLRFQLNQTKKDLSDITQLKLDRILKTQQNFHRDFWSIFSRQQCSNNELQKDSIKKRRKEHQ